MADPQAVNGEYLADPSDLAQRTGESVDSGDLLLALRRASNRFRGDVGHHVYPVQEQEHYASGDGGSAIRLPAAPIVGDVVVKVDGNTVTDYQTGRRAGLLRRNGGWPDGLENVHVTFSSGYAKIPGDISDAVLEAAEASMNVVAGVESIGTGSESVKLSALHLNGGVTEAWTNAVNKYNLDAGGRS